MNKRGTIFFIQSGEYAVRSRRISGHETWNKARNMVQNDMVVASANEAQWLARGRREGFAIAALATSLIAFPNLLSMEKGALALVFAWLAMRGPIAAKARRNAKIAIGLALLQFATIALIVHHIYTHYYQLVRLFNQLG
jgi:hypothetical protein